MLGVCTLIKYVAVWMLGVCTLMQYVGFVYIDRICGSVDVGCVYIDRICGSVDVVCVCTLTEYVAVWLWGVCTSDRICGGVDVECVYRGEMSYRTKYTTGVKHWSCKSNWERHTPQIKPTGGIHISGRQSGMIRQILNDEYNNEIAIRLTPFTLYVYRNPHYVHMIRLIQAYMLSSIWHN